MLKYVSRSLASILVIFLLFSCENEYSEVGTDFINSIEAQPAYESDNVVAYSEKHNSIRTNGFSNYFLGSYADPVFGLSEAKILTQINLSETNPDFGSDPILDSVVMTLPFYSSQVQQDEFNLDSIYGEGSFKIKVFRSNQFLRELDPGPDGDFQDRQFYYTDQFDEFSSNIELDRPIVTSDIIRPSEMKDPVVVFERNEEDQLDLLSLSPRIRIKMPVDFFQDNVVNPPNPEVLASNSAFNNFLRGFLITAEQQQTVQSMAMFNLQSEDANITIYYKNEVEDENENGDTEFDYGEFVLNFNGIKLNLYENNFNVDLSNQDTEEGEENIYLKGGEGSSGIIELFAGPDSDGDGISDELEELRNNNWLINEARLDLYLNEDLATTSKNRINRVFLFNLDDQQILSDYTFDPTEQKLSHLGALNDNDGNPFYRIRITSFIDDLLNSETISDTTNVKLGLYVSTNVNEPNLVETRNTELGISETVPRSMVNTPRGIVIHGNQSAVEAKKLKLRIIYTETN